ncbi:MAG: hypothetical protein UX94_C0019G0005 [Parcubacteria group bacterium GW2011_GWA2_47_21]|nr:MAG: hypothetical protein UX94_C0019G0005 [Parcubacteria group bacterium GW2011_GWA2_47_21]
MKLTIYSLKGVEFEGEAASFNVRAEDGEITVLDHHRPLITLLAGGARIVQRQNRSMVRIKREFDSLSGLC